MTPTPFGGVYPAVTTPFGEDGRIDFDQLTAAVARLERAGVDGVVPVGSTGESATLSHDEHVQVVDAVAGATNLPVVAGAGSNSTREAVSLSERSAAAGADALLQIAPYYNRPEPAGFRTHFRRLADAVDLPQVLYNVPGRTGRSLTADTVADLAAHPNVAGYKAASGDLGHVGEVIERTRGERFDVLAGDDALALPVVALGGTGVVSVAANVVPGRMCDLVAAAREGDLEAARGHQAALGPLFRALFAESNPGPVKAALAAVEDHPPTLRDPLGPVAPETRERVLAALADLGVGAAEEVSG